MTGELCSFLHDDDDPKISYRSFESSKPFDVPTNYHQRYSRKISTVVSHLSCLVQMELLPISSEDVVHTGGLEFKATNERATYAQT
ncbi:predicted protein [Botrytis cinerea T4]|uniref:Uncharacterized protein n=1 Tax=Botryotinia fuckeliana (strain T4) TaxID=999810 RepID=G2YKF0_BOTF4|nr:predicted protein [Botrytis cinerea T4]